MPGPTSFSADRGAGRGRVLLPDGRFATHLDEIASRRVLDVAGREVGRAIAEIETGNFDVVRERHDGA